MKPKLGWLPTQDCSSQHHQAEQVKRSRALCAEEAWSPRNRPCCCCGWGRLWAPDGFISPPNGLGELCHSVRKDSSDSLLLSLFYSFIQLLEPKSVLQLFQHLSLTGGFSLKDVQNLGTSRFLRCRHPASPHHHTPPPASPCIYPGCPDFSSLRSSQGHTVHTSVSSCLSSEETPPKSPHSLRAQTPHSRIGISHRKIADSTSSRFPLVHCASATWASPA